MRASSSVFCKRATLALTGRPYSTQPPRPMSKRGARNDVARDRAASAHPAPRLSIMRDFAAPRGSKGGSGPRRGSIAAGSGPQAVASSGSQAAGSGRRRRHSEPPRGESGAKRAIAERLAFHEKSKADDAGALWESGARRNLGFGEATGALSCIGRTYQHPAPSCFLFRGGAFPRVRGGRRVEDISGTRYCVLSGALWEPLLVFHRTGTCYVLEHNSAGRFYKGKVSADPILQKTNTVQYFITVCPSGM